MITELHSILPNLPNFNINKIQHSILSSMQNNYNIIFINADKNQGLVAMDHKYYITCMLQQHCLNKQNYKLLSPSEAYKLYKELSNSLKNVIIRDKYEMSENEYNYFQKNFNLKHCVLQIYGAPKLHKDKKEQPNTIPSHTMKMQKSSRSSLKMD